VKIDKVIFSCSLEYGAFWNINSKVLKECLGLDSVCLLYGHKNDLISDEYGEIIECSYNPNLPKIVQLVLNKFYHTQTEPDTTWMIGDIDQLPLQSKRFVEEIADIPTNFYVHLAENANTMRMSPDPIYWQQHPVNSNDGNAQLPAHYHVAKGSTLQDFLKLDIPFEEYVNNLVKKKLQITSMNPLTTFSEILELEKKMFFWAYEEGYTTDFLREKLHLNRYKGFARNTSLDRVCRSTGCSHNDSDLRNKKYIDIHCPRPYIENKETINKIINQVWDIEL
tara:strand:- start:5535 stop:6374 length:840 start_codon:yes stop_codon:yes gene_type:complete